MFAQESGGERKGKDDDMKYIEIIINNPRNHLRLSLDCGRQDTNGTSLGHLSNRMR